MEKWECLACGCVYDPAVGDPDSAGSSPAALLRVAALDPAAYRLTLRHRPSTGSGQAPAGTSDVEYDRLLLATGGRPFVPPCEGTDKKGVFTLRTLKDGLAIKTHVQEVSTAVVVGGGLLGLETARALRTAGLEVTVVSLPPTCCRAKAQGLQVLTSAATEAILGDGHAIRSEVGLAQAAGLEVNRGIVVDEQLQTSAESATYTGTLSATTLKVAGAELTSLGECVVESVVSAHVNRLLDDDFDLKSLLP